MLMLKSPRGAVRPFIIVLAVAISSIILFSPLVPHSNRQKVLGLVGKNDKGRLGLVSLGQEDDSLR